MIQNVQMEDIQRQLADIRSRDHAVIVSGEESRSMNLAGLRNDIPNVL